MNKGLAMGVSTRRSCAVVLVALAACTEAPLGEDPRADPRDSAKLALGAKVYAQHCAVCHGAKLEGQPNWTARLPNGRLPAPPHDDSGHTWHHPDYILFSAVRDSLVPPYAPKGYETDMPAFGGKLSDDQIWAVITYIKSHWTQHVLPARAEMLQNAASK